MANIISPASKGNRWNGSYKQEGLDTSGLIHYRICGYALIPASGTTAASVDIIIPSQQKNMSDTVGLVIPANSLIRQVAFQTLKNVTLGAATGKLKLATALAASTTTLYVESAAASSNTLARQTTRVATQNITPVTVGGSNVTYKLYATDGGAAGAAAASTATSTDSSRAKVLVMIEYATFSDFPDEDSVGYSASDRV